MQGFTTFALWVMVAILVASVFRYGATLSFWVVVGGASILYLSWGRPRVGLVLWLLSLTMIPIWFNVHFFTTIPVHCIVAIMVAATAVGHRRFEFNAFDAYLALFLMVALVAVSYNNSYTPMWSEMVVRWATPYFAIRVLAPAAGMRFSTEAFAVVLALVGGLATAEFALVWHPFASWNVNWNSLSAEYATWSPIQNRGGLDRSEWAFGHSIALGGTLALAIPFIARSALRGGWKVLLLLAVGGGIMTTASRSAMLAAAITAFMCLAYTASRRAVRTVAVLVLVATLIAAPFVAPTLQDWAEGSSVEAQTSASYRNDLYTAYAPLIEWFGRSARYFASRGAVTDSVDSAVLHIGLNFGWVVLALALLPLLACVVRVAAGRATTAEIALVGQIPLLTTVALITQYQSFVFIVVGFAVQSALDSRPAAVPRRRSGGPQREAGSVALTPVAPVGRSAKRQNVIRT